MSVSGAGPFNPPFQRPTGDWQAFYLRYRVSPWCKVPVALLQRVTAFLTRSWTNNLYHHQRNQHPSLHHGYWATQKSAVLHSCFFNSVHLALSLQLFLTFNIKVRGVCASSDLKHARFQNSIISESGPTQNHNPCLTSILILYEFWVLSLLKMKNETIFTSSGFAQFWAQWQNMYLWNRVENRIKSACWEDSRTVMMGSGCYAVKNKVQWWRWEWGH